MRIAWISVGAMWVLLTFVAGATAQSPEFTDGRTLFLRHCASCHGADGKGTGSMAASLSRLPPDLTILQAEGQEFPALQVAEAIKGTDDRGAEQFLAAPPCSPMQADMPAWEREFRTMGVHEPDRAISRLVVYVQKMQVYR